MSFGIIVRPMRVLRQLCRIRPLAIKHYPVNEIYTEQKKETHTDSNAEFNDSRNCPKIFLVWIKSTICRESSFDKQKFIVAFALAADPCSKVNNGCDKPCDSCTTLYLRGMNGLRWVALACGMSSQTSWITRHNCTMASGGGSRDFSWQSARSLVDARWGTGWWVR